MKPIIHKELPVYAFESKESFYSWLGKNYVEDKPFWLRYYKKGTNTPTIVHGDAVDVALCWGWIDGLVNKYDEESYVVRFTQRRPKSVWSQVNVAKVGKLTSEGLMQPSGLAQVERAKADGRWAAAYAGQATIQVPNEFISLLKTDPSAEAFYNSLNKNNKYAIAFRIATAVGQEKKQGTIEKLFKMLQDKKTLN